MDKCEKCAALERSLAEGTQGINQIDYLAGTVDLLQRQLADVTRERDEARKALSLAEAYLDSRTPDFIRDEIEAAQEAPK